MNMPRNRFFLALVAAAMMSGCSKAPPPDTSTTSAPPANNDAPAATEAPPPKELSQPVAGKGNVQGKVLFNDKPATNIEVTLSEKFSTFLGASGKSYTARTDKSGDYVIKNVPPKEYEGLTARVFDTNSVIFIKSGILQAKKYSVEAGKTLFVDATHLFKSDLKILSPKAAATVGAKTAKFQWQAYPGAAYYKISLYADDFKISSGVFEERVNSTSYQTEKPLPAGGYRLEVEAYNAADHKLAESRDRYKFRVAS